MNYRLIFLIIFMCVTEENLQSQDTTYILNTSMMNDDGYLYLPDMTDWHFRMGNDSSWNRNNLNLTEWSLLDSTNLSSLEYDENNTFECWMRIKIRLDSSFYLVPLYLLNTNTAAQILYVNGELYESFGNIGINGKAFKSHESRQQLPKPLRLAVNQDIELSIHFKDNIGTLSAAQGLDIIGLRSILVFLSHEAMMGISDNTRIQAARSVFILSVFGVLLLLTWLLALMNRKEGHLTLVALLISSIFISIGFGNISDLLNNSNEQKALFLSLALLGLSASLILLPLVTTKIFIDRIPKWLKIYCVIAIVAVVIIYFKASFPSPVILLAFATIYNVYLIIASRKNLVGPKWFVVGGMGLVLILLSFGVLANYIGFRINSPIYPIVSLLTLPVSLLLYMTFWLRDSIKRERENSKQLLLLTEEKQAILIGQNELLERQVDARTNELRASLDNLKAAQAQLIQSEKMASLGELTAGIAHEIQNPLNFVNNFSELNNELIDEMEQELVSGNMKEAIDIAKDLKLNLGKINHHGKRAEEIIKSMLQHSRTSNAQKELTDINTLCDEYLRLAFHGMRAKDKSFNANHETHFDPSLPKIEVIPQDIGRVLLNLINNAFQAMAEVENPQLTITTSITSSSREGEGGVPMGIFITISDNGPGIPDSIKDKIFQPFFTTKPTGQGTGLGLSLSYDIVKAHGGEIRVKSENGKDTRGTEFKIFLPFR